jgi:hypothetical protein
VDVEMRHLLVGVAAVVGEDAVAGGVGAELARRLADRAEEAGDLLRRRPGGEVVHRDVLALGDDEHVDRRERVDVAERQRVLALVHLVARQFAAQDSREHVAVVVGHDRPSLGCCLGGLEAVARTTGGRKASGARAVKARRRPHPGGVAPGRVLSL